MGASSSSSAGTNTSVAFSNLNVKSTTLHTTTSSTLTLPTWTFPSATILASIDDPSGAVTNDGVDATTLSTSAVSQYVDLESSLQEASASSTTSTVNFPSVQTDGGAYGAQTNGGAYNTGNGQAGSAATTEAQSYTISTQNGGVCLMSYVGASPVATQSYATYVPATTVAGKKLRARASASIFTATNGITDATSSTGGEEQVPLSDIPPCQTAAAAVATTDGGSAAVGEATSAAAGSFSNQDKGSGGGLNAGQRGGIAAGVVVAIVLLIVAAVWWIRRLGMQRQLTSAQRNLWDSGTRATGPGNTVGGRNADVTEAGQMVSGMSLREALYGPSGARSFRG